MDATTLICHRAVLEEFLTPSEVNKLLAGEKLANARRGVFVEWRSRFHFALDPSVQPHVGRGGYLGERYVFGRGFRRAFADFFGTSGWVVIGNGDRHHDGEPGEQHIK